MIDHPHGLPDEDGVYWRAYLNDKGEPCAVCVQGFDGPDYDARKFLTPYKYANAYTALTAAQDAADGGPRLVRLRAEIRALAVQPEGNERTGDLIALLAAHIGDARVISEIAALGDWVATDEHWNEYPPKGATGPNAAEYPPKGATGPNAAEYWRRHPKHREHPDNQRKDQTMTECSREPGGNWVEDRSLGGDVPAIEVLAHRHADHGPRLVWVPPVKRKPIPTSEPAAGTRMIVRQAIEAAERTGTQAIIRVFEYPPSVPGSPRSVGVSLLQGAAQNYLSFGARADMGEGSDSKKARQFAHVITRDGGIWILDETTHD